MEVLLEALTVAAPRGWCLVPLRGKNPAPLLGSGWPDRATAHHPTVEEWAAAWPGANAGAVPFETFVALDIDPRNGGDDTLHRLERELGELPLTPTYRTGGRDGGWRVMLAHPGGPMKGILGAGVEVKRGRQQVVLPPSIHPDTERRYQWEHHPDEVSLAGLPERWLEALLCKPPSPRVARQDDANDPLRSFPPSTYAHALAGLAAGSDGKVACPFHSDRTPSLHIYPTAAEGWYCFGCTRGGDIYTFASYCYHSYVGLPRRP